MNEARAQAVSGDRQRARVTQAELDRALRLHEMFKAGRPGGQRAILTWRDMSGLKLA
jgi:hypothetical protein